MHCCANDLIFIDSWHGHLGIVLRQKGGRTGGRLTDVWGGVLLECMKKEGRRWEMATARKMEKREDGGIEDVIRNGEDLARRAGGRH